MSERTRKNGHPEGCLWEHFTYIPRYSSDMKKLGKMLTLSTKYKNSIVRI